MGNDANNKSRLPETRTEVTERKQSMDIECLSNALKWIHNYMKIPDKMLDKDDLFTIQQISYYIRELYEYEDVRMCGELRYYPKVDGVLWKYIQYQSKQHEQYLIKLDAKKRRTQAVKTSTVATSLLVSLVLLTHGFFSYGYGYDLLGNLAEWGKSILGISRNDTVSENDVTLVINDTSTVYGSVEDAINSLDIDILYPSWLPDEVYVTMIVYVESDNYLSFVFNDKNMKIQIDLSVESIVDIENKTLIGSYICDAFFNNNLYHIMFIDDSKVYNIKYSNYEDLVKIITNLK